MTYQAELEFKTDTEHEYQSISAIQLREMGSWSFWVQLSCSKLFLSLNSLHNLSTSFSTFLTLHNRRHWIHWDAWRKLRPWEQDQLFWDNPQDKHGLALGNFSLTPSLMRLSGGCFLGNQDVEYDNKSSNANGDPPNTDINKLRAFSVQIFVNGFRFVWGKVLAFLVGYFEYKA